MHHPPTLPSEKHRISIMLSSLQTSTPYHRPSPEAHSWPPVSIDQEESSEDAGRRLAREREAKLQSEKIDRALLLERSQRKRGKPAAKILLLGQSESGKSTTLKNFQLNFAPQAFKADAEAWRTVIHLNLIRSVIFLLDILRQPRFTDADHSDPENEQHGDCPTATGLHIQPTEPVKRRPRTADNSLTRAGGLIARGSDTTGETHAQAYSPELRRLMLSLLPLKSVEANLCQRLGAIQSSQKYQNSANLDWTVQTDPMKGAISFGVSSHHRELSSRPSSSHSTASSSSNKSLRSRDILRLGLARQHSTSSSSTTPCPTRPSELDNFPKALGFHYSDSDSQNMLLRRRNSFSFQKIRLQNLVEFAIRVRGNSGWKRLARISFEPDIVPAASEPSVIDAFNDDQLTKKEVNVSEILHQDEECRNIHEERELLTARQIVNICGEDIDRLWRDTEVQSLLKHARIDLESQPGFFLNDALRITSDDYIPTSDDILRARISTIGVEEHSIVMEGGPEAGKEWIIYDVGGTRSQRAAWAPFFDSVNVIIFLAPISSFDEWLAEDPSVNRLEDTFELWLTICKNRLLASVGFILFLNKHDVLRAKLRSGIRFSSYVSNYDDENGAKNDADSIAKFMLAKFSSAHRKLSPKPRQLRAYLTSVIDSRATSKVLQHIREQVIVEYLAEANVL